MRKCAALLTMIALTGRGEPEKPAFVSVDSLWTSTTRYRATEIQVAACEADRSPWEGPVDRLSGFNAVRSKRCLQPSPFLR